MERRHNAETNNTTNQEHNSTSMIESQVLKIDRERKIFNLNGVQTSLKYIDRERIYSKIDLSLYFSMFTAISKLVFYGVYTRLF